MKTPPHKWGAIQTLGYSNVVGSAYFSGNDVAKENGLDYCVRLLVNAEFLLRRLQMVHNSILGNEENFRNFPSRFTSCGPEQALAFTRRQMNGLAFRRGIQAVENGLMEIERESMEMVLVYCTQFVECPGLVLGRDAEFS